MQKQVNEDLIVQEIHAIRKYQPRCGGRKLLIMLQPFLEEQKILMGRDTFFTLLANNKLLVRKTKRGIQTTNSKHHFRRFPNLAKDFKIKRRKNENYILAYFTCFWLIIITLAFSSDFSNCLMRCFKAEVSLRFFGCIGVKVTASFSSVLL